MYLRAPYSFLQIPSSKRPPNKLQMLADPMDGATAQAAVLNYSIYLDNMAMKGLLLFR